VDKIDTELQNNFQSSLNPHDAHVQAWTGQLYALHPLALIERIRQAERESFGNAWDYWQEVDKPTPTNQTEPAPAPAPVPAPVPAPTTAAPEPAQVVAAAAPAPLTTRDIAFCFAGLRWDEQGWKKPLGDKPKWLAECVAIPGQRGVSETRWNPVLIGAALVEPGHLTVRQVRARFQNVPLLHPWLDAWKTYEADNCDTP